MLTGTVAPGYARVRDAFASVLDLDPTTGAQLCAYVGGEKVIDLTGGTGLAEDTLLPVYSSSKGLIGVVMALLLQRGQLALDAPVASYWPEFAAGGKAAVTVRQLLSHQAGLVGVDGRFTIGEVIAHDPLAERLAAQAPMWAPGTAHGYHAVTLGTLAEELVRRITGKTLSEVYVEALPGVDVHLGTPAALDARVSAVDLPTAAELAQWAEVLPATSADSLAPQAEPSDGPLFFMVNEVPFRRAGQAAAGALGTARGLAEVYARVGAGLLTDEVLAQVTAEQVAGPDLIAGRESRYGIVFELATSWLPFGGPRAFGHGGLGGSVAFFDPDHDLAFGYLPKRLPPPSGIERVLSIIRSLH